MADSEILLAYSSAATRRFEPADLVDLLTVARKKNAELGLTGMLLYLDESFFQILEGDPAKLRPLYEKIIADKRHARVVKLIEEPIEKRSFSSWSMGHATATRKDLAKIDGLNDFFSGGAALSELEPSRAKSLLEAFRDGKWRSRLRG